MYIFFIKYKFLLLSVIWKKPIHTYIYIDAGLGGVYRIWYIKSGIPHQDQYLNLIQLKYRCWWGIPDKVNPVYWTKILSGNKSRIRSGR